MKTTKTELKKIVKECLIEILSEGIDFSSQQAQRESKTNDFSGHRLSETRQNKFQPSNVLKDAIKREAGGNQVMANIFADTAKNTLPKMISSDVGNNVSGLVTPGAGVEQFNGTPETVFNESAAKWAALAFADAPKK